ncbi:MAG: hypothetical protein M1816_004218 [Peltula sp. TS41687]|nr:MAG: hypothetical protein M1816_004218 [Peltula sp. TS41687]
MSSSFARQLKSGLIRLRVGAESEYAVHRGLLSQNLTKLDISAHERIIDFEGDEDAVASLLEFLYTRDYAIEDEDRGGTVASQSSAEVAHGSAGDAETGGAEQEVHPMVLAARSSGLGVWGRPAAVHTKLWEEDEDSSSSAGDADADAIATAGKDSSTSSDGKDEARKHADKSATSAVLIHAKVYLLAEKYGYSALMDFALQKLRAALKTSELEVPTDHTTSLVTLIKSVYGQPLDEESQDQGQGHESKQQQLRDVVITQTADRLPVLQTNGDFKAFLKDGGDFAGDLLSHLAKTQLTLRG